MLEEFRVDNYKSLINIVFRPREINLLLGLNNSGKTNLCQAMWFVSQTSSRALDDCADNIAEGRMGIANFFFQKPTVDFFIKSTVPFGDVNLLFEYSLTISVPVKPFPERELEVESEKLVVTGEKFDNVALLNNNRETNRILDETAYLKGVKKHETMVAPRDATMLSRLYDINANARAICFKNYLKDWQYYSLSPEQLKSPNHKPNEMKLNADGSNLASVIYNLKMRNEREYRRLLPHLQELDASIDLINFQVGSPSKVFMYFEDKQGHSLPAHAASNGTLRFLGLIYLFLVQPSLGGHPFIVVEEPENCIYVGFLKGLIELASQGGSQAQMIFTSHSPYFIDLFDNRLDSVFILKRGDQHSTLHQPDVEKVRARLKQFSLGDQHFREMLG